MFRNADNHLLIVKAMAAKNKGLTRNEILEATGLPNAGSATRVLDELEQSDFIRRYTSFGQKKRDEMYQLTDATPYSIFISYRMAKTTTSCFGSIIWAHQR